MPYIDFKQLEQLDTADQQPSNVSWHSTGISHTGNQRQLNEDAYLNSAEQGLWAVADGMGGLARGDYASSVVVESLLYYSGTKSIAASIRELEIQLRDAHARCRNSFPGERVGSTIATLFAHQQYAFFIWAGDSRIYRLRENQLELMTKDHTVAQERCDIGQLTPQQAAVHPSAHVLTRAVGVHQTLHLDLDYETVQAGDRYLLCSDGLYGALDTNVMQELLGKENIENARDQLLAEALRSSGHDNITAVIAEATSID